MHKRLPHLELCLFWPLETHSHFFTQTLDNTSHLGILRIIPKKQVAVFEIVIWQGFYWYHRRVNGVGAINWQINHWASLQRDLTILNEEIGALPSALSL